MVLKINSTNKEEIIIELTDPKNRRLNKLVQKQKLGSQVLLPMIVKILKKNKLSFNDLTGIEVNPGPGSFTGTRVGVSVANALGYALNLPVNGKRGKIVVPIYEKSKFDI
jgi:tRNA threonylcarbamoyl adenosine modification protein YeaZ